MGILEQLVNESRIQLLRFRHEFSDIGRDICRRPNRGSRHRNSAEDFSRKVRGQLSLLREHSQTIEAGPTTTAVNVIWRQRRSPIFLDCGMLEPPSAWQSLEPSAAVWLIELQERFALVTASRSAILMHIAKQQERNPMTMRPDPTLSCGCHRTHHCEARPHGPP